MDKKILTFLLSKLLYVWTYLYGCLISEFQCIASECQGRNSFNNLLWLSKSILGGILKMPPTSETREIEWLLEKIQNLELSVAEVIETVKKYLKKGIEP